MYFPENATVFPHGADPEKIQAARDRGEIVVVLPGRSWYVPAEKEE